MSLTVDTSSSRSNIAMISGGAAWSLPGNGDSDVTRIGSNDVSAIVYWRRP